MHFFPSATEAYIPPRGRELSRNFRAKLKAYDPACEAIHDEMQDALIIWSRRQGLQVHELTVKREFGENYEELENRTLKKLEACDVWKRFKDSPNPGKAYDDWLHAEEERLRLERKKEGKARRLAYFKENRWMIEAALENARQGRFRAHEIVPYKIPQISRHVEPAKNTGVVIRDRRSNPGLAQKLIAERESKTA